MSLKKYKTLCWFVFIVFALGFVLNLQAEEIRTIYLAIPATGMLITIIFYFLGEKK